MRRRHGLSPVNQRARCACHLSNHLINHRRAHKVGVYCTPMIRRRKFHRAVFVAAGIYNIAWGLYSVYDPQWLFRFSGLPPLNYPAIFACLAMVVGLYGIIYFEVARVPERGWLLALVGLIGKVLGPIGLARLIWSGAWPKSTLVLCLTNDLIWWIPFALYLYDAWRFRPTVSAARP